ncbi:hypothetical protein IP90_02456 [Luteimonas cucumeris]|uniref:Uncharacterized protein n=1 Tax=Luteimonas cucumeris TaxID=985012 RepID=A0A562L2Z4_9GAMM|nr:hypothetical protein [Luteimonas cucumeris]TWI01896.1 hypothetical protein IP90_02456 [Luteimonas cucumeris]
MIRSGCHRLPLALRVFVLGLLAFGLVTKPVLASIGELHEFAHDSTQTHALAGHEDHAQAAADASTDDRPHDEHPQEERGTDALHALVHFVHCCGQTPLASLPALAIMATPPASGTLLMSAPQMPPQALSLAPFRPPIAV